MKISIAFLVIIASVTCSPNPQKGGPSSEPDFDIFDYFLGFFFDDDEDYDFNNKNVTSESSKLKLTKNII